MPVNTEIQQKTVLKALMSGPATTIQLRELNILSPAPRVQELREMGFFIVTERVYFYDSGGKKHKVGEYHLLDHEQLTLRGELILESLSK